MINIAKNRLILSSFYLSAAIAINTFSGCVEESKGKDEEGASSQNSMAVPVKQRLAHSVSFQDGNGKVIALNELEGKVVFINFWATWCPPCIQEMPSIQKLKDEFKDNDNLVFMLVDVDGKHEQAQAFMDQRKLDLPVFIPHSKIPTEFLGNAIPTTIILDKKGAIAARVEGGRDYSMPEVINGIRELVNE